MKTISARISQELLSKIKKVSKARGISMSAFIRQVLENLFINGERSSTSTVKN